MAWVASLGYTPLSQIVSFLSIEIFRVVKIYNFLMIFYLVNFELKLNKFYFEKFSHPKIVSFTPPFTLL